VNKREFIAFFGGAAVWPIAARAQQAGGIRRVVVLMGAAETAWSRGWLASFLQRLDELGWREGYNVVTQVQWWRCGPGLPNSLPVLAREFKSLERAGLIERRRGALVLTDTSRLRQLIEQASEF
jgi:hypothetical protein